MHIELARENLQKKIIRILRTVTNTPGKERGGLGLVERPAGCIGVYSPVNAISSPLIVPKGGAPQIKRGAENAHRLEK